MICYLHIGTAKTGTTSIQEFLAKNKKNLLEEGFYFSQSLGRAHNIGLPVIAYNYDKNDSYIKTHNLNDKFKLKKHQESLYRRLEKELEQVNVPKVIFSSEFIHSRLTTVEELTRLKRKLIQLGFEKIIVICYLREPASAVASLYSTGVKSGSILSHFPAGPRENEYFENLCNHRKTIDRYIEVFGQENLIVRLFEKTTLVNKSIIDDFLFAIGARNNTYERINNNENKSLNLIGLTILRHVYMKIPRFKNGKLNPQIPIVNSISSLIYHHFSLDTRDDKYKYALPKDIYDDYQNYFYESNEYVRRKLFSDRETLFEKSLEDYKENYMMQNESEIEKLIPFIIDSHKIINSMGQNGMNRFNNKLSRKRKLWIAGKKLSEKIGIYPILKPFAKICKRIMNKE